MLHWDRFIYADSVIFDHRDTYDVPIRVGIDAPSNDEYPVNYPWFGNPMMIPSHDSGRIYAIPFGGAGLKNLDVYDAVNDPIGMWIYYLGVRYDRRFTLDYTMEQDSKRIVVYFTGTAEDGDGSTVPLDQTFLYDIENASPDNLPTWLNEEDLSEECKEYWFFYITNWIPCWNGLKKSWRQRRKNRRIVRYAALSYLPNKMLPQTENLRERCFFNTGLLQLLYHCQKPVRYG